MFWNRESAIRLRHQSTSLESTLTDEELIEDLRTFYQMDENTSLHPDVMILFDHALQHFSITYYAGIFVNIANGHSVDVGSAGSHLRLLHFRISPTGRGPYWSLTGLETKPTWSFKSRDRASEGFDYLEWHDTRWRAFVRNTSSETERWTMVYEGPSLSGR